MSYQDPQILRRLKEQGLTDIQIAKIYNKGYRTIGYFRKKFGIPSLPPESKIHRKYTLNEDFFAIIDNPDKAYILGFIMADGYVYANRRALSIAISQQDEQLLNDILRAIGSDAPIRSKKKSKWGKNNLSVINLCSKKMIRDLVTFGVIPNKSHVLFYPSDIPSHLEKHLIRGLWDGDGYIGKKQFMLAGSSLLLLQGVSDAIAFHTGLPGKIINSSTPNNFRLYYNRSAADALRWMYSDNGLRLERKYNQLLRFWI